MMDVKKLAQVAGGGGARSAEIGRQISLPWSDAFRISIKNVLLRLGRATITATGIVLGVAFLMYVLSDRVFSEGVEKSNAVRVQVLEQATGPKEATPGTEAQAAPGEPAPESKAAQEAAALAKERSARQVWLVVMSLLVCGIGITNAMLMSVTERFREIGTMKCLGALDSFVVRLVLIEAAAIGVLGSLAGLIVGFLATLAIYTIRNGASVTAKINWAELAGYAAFAVLVGAALSLLAAIPPAVRAAHMPPAAALRSEI